MMIIRECTISELEQEPNIHTILDEYAAESSIKGLPTPKALVQTYKNLEASGALHVIGAYINSTLIGYITVLSPVMPHYSAVVSVTESYFVMAEYRSTGAGLKLLRAAEQYAESIGSAGLLVSAPTGGRLAEVLPRVGYNLTNQVFFKGFADE